MISPSAVFLAHHVAVTSDELGTGTVAELLREPRLFQAEWDGHVGITPARSIPAAAQRRGSPDSWRLVAGDQEWARVWVELWRAQNGRASFLILPEKTDVRSLFADALSLLPASEANQVAFITHLNADRAGVHFDWIGLTAGSEMGAPFESVSGSVTGYYLAVRTRSGVTPSFKTPRARTSVSLACAGSTIRQARPCRARLRSRLEGRAATASRDKIAGQPP